MNNIKKQADWRSTLGDAGSAVTQAVKNFYNTGSTYIHPSAAKVNAANAAAKATSDGRQAQIDAQNKITANNAAAKQHGSDILTYGLGGLGAGIVLTRLHHLLSGANTQQPKYTKFGPGPKGVEEDEKIANDNWYTKIVSAPGHLIQNFSDPANRDAAKAVLMMGGTMGGLYGGYSIMSQLAEKKRKEELQARVDDAKKEYQRALTGRKVAADLDAAFATISKQAADGKSDIVRDTALWLADTAFEPIRLTGLMPAYALTTAGLGGLSGKMMYDWTRARSKDKALAEARKARARIGGAAPIYIDPEQLAAVKRVAD
jgi:hypothetical protein